MRHVRSVKLRVTGEDPPLDRLRAAARLVGNHEAVARFAARGCGSEGRRPVSAPLSDPTARPGEESVPDVDAGVHGCVSVSLHGSCMAVRFCVALQ